MEVKNNKDGMEYILVLWPDSQELMEYEWFRDECYLLQAFDDQEHYDSSYIVPKHRIEALDKKEDE